MPLLPKEARPLFNFFWMSSVTEETSSGALRPSEAVNRDLRKRSDGRRDWQTPSQVARAAINRGEAFEAWAFQGVTSPKIGVNKDVAMFTAAFREHGFAHIIYAVKNEATRHEPVLSYKKTHRPVPATRMMR